jgi:hypothetical protein
MLLLSNPLLARMASVSEEEAETFPPPRKYQWAYSRYRIEALDFRRGIRWRNAVKVRNASRRAIGFLIRMADLLAEPKDRVEALEAIERYASLGDALSTGRWFRSGEEAAEDLHRFVLEHLAPPVALEGEPASPPPPDCTSPFTAGIPWTVRAKREVAEETGEGKRIRFVLELSNPEGVRLERDVSESDFRTTRLGEAWPPVPPAEKPGSGPSSKSGSSR